MDAVLVATNGISIARAAVLKIVVKILLRKQEIKRYEG